MRSTTRSISFGLILGTLLVFGAHLAVSGPVFGADDEAKPASLKKLRAQVEALQEQVEYLRSREEALTAYALATGDQAATLDAAVKRARTQGFESRAMAAESRVTLLSGLEGMAAGLRAGLPVVTKDQLRLRKAADAASK